MALDPGAGFWHLWGMSDCCFDVDAVLADLPAAIADGTLNHDNASRIGLSRGQFALLLGVLTAPTPSSTQRSVTSSSVNTGGTVAAGAYSITFIFSSDYTGNVDGVAYDGANDATITVTAPGSDTLDAVAYTVTTGTLRIVKVV